MNLGKTLLFGSVLAAGAGLAVSTEAQAAENYTVQSGDTLSKISQKIAGDNSLVNTIAEANSITDVNMIYAGQTLTINSGNTEATPATDTAAAATEATPAPVVEEATPEATPTPAVEEAAPAVAETAAPAATVSGSDAAAKEWIAQKESGGSYTATNGQYIGRYQLTNSYLNGDYSAANQEAVADQYVTSRYGSWTGAQAFWQANGWY
ncbi:aggregation-promoting factor [Enterococcus alishanensis]|uniref:LysM peptidoglycan-binding domain-containing protein n=1 Tax=Enterococcus alishanensis TaxID=1303817 RepID=A0ABS6THA1_9ENTE|nr:LysM peptidoglycan-binding domain-containing protein [Enterococcus alishanensis]MBV7392359.1 LysM peptidoglycan-binding domain-containing protein [Enterococcus alishanensis]